MLSKPETVNDIAFAGIWIGCESVTVVLTATDGAGGSGVKQIKFATTGAQTTFGIVHGGEASIVITANGTTKVQFSATDNAGNTEPAKALTVNIDRASP